MLDVVAVVILYVSDPRMGYVDDESYHVCVILSLRSRILGRQGSTDSPLLLCVCSIALYSSSFMLERVDGVYITLTSHVGCAHMCLRIHRPPPLTRGTWNWLFELKNAQQRLNRACFSSERSLSTCCMPASGCCACWSAWASRKQS